MRGPHAAPRLVVIDLSRNMAGVIEAGTAGVLAAACAVICCLFNSIQPQPYMVSIAFGYVTQCLNHPRSAYPPTLIINSVGLKL